MSESEGYQNHHPSGCRGCPLDKTGRGFCLGAGDPQKAKYAVILEAPGSQEISFTLTPNAHRSFLSTKEECEEEIATRQRDYPELSNGSIRTGVPAVGPTGLALQHWIWGKVGIRREDVFIDNTIRCLPPKGKSGQPYPTGETRKAAEQHCRQYDRIASFRPDTTVFSLHPAGILREITPLPLAIKDFEKVRDFTAQGRRVLVLLGGKATSAFARYGSNIGRWRGHFAALPKGWAENYKAVFEFKKKERKKKEVKLDEWGNPVAVQKRSKKKTVLQEELRENQSPSTGVQSDSSSNQEIKKVRKRAKRKVCCGASKTCTIKSSGVCSEELCKHSSVQPTDKASGV
jgi:uracil-DNA glycosylase